MAEAASAPKLADLQETRTRLLQELSAIEVEIADAVLQDELPTPITIDGEPSTLTECFDPNFGFLTKSAGVYVDTEGDLDGVGGVPTGFVDLAVRNFLRELPEAREAWEDVLSAIGFGQPGASIGRLRQRVQDAVSRAEEVCGIDPLKVESEKCITEAAKFRRALRGLKLDNDAIWAREEARPKVDAPSVLLGPYYVLCWVLDNLFDGRPISRFWFLETVARMPYFSYISLLHLYESLGWWRRSAETKRVHFAEEWNEFHHLLIMESLGGDQLWSDRFLAQHAAIVYYWILVFLWLLSPSLSYNFSELIEAHAVDTYAEFVDANAEALARLPAPRIAKLYYGGKDLYLFDEFQTARPRGSRRVHVETLFDVFSAIRDDEAEHVATMSACKDPSVIVRSPTVELGVAVAASTAAVASVLSKADEVQVAAEAAGDLVDVAGIGGLAEWVAGIGLVVGPILEKLIEIFANGA